MSTAIQFLEAAGGNPKRSAADYDASVAMLQIDPAQRQALFDRDHHTLSSLLDGRTKMYCYIVAPDSDEPEPMPDDGDEVPARE